jgi:release factor glutamine methyltransferase
MKPTASLKQDLTKNKDSLLKRLQGELSPFTETPYLDSVVLVSSITHGTKSQLLANPNPDLTPAQHKELTHALTRIKTGTPLPYVIGEWEFFQNRFLITEDVLIPRPETEGLVDLALTWLQDHPHRRACLEIGTGSGCIAITLAKLIPELQIIATDVSQQALQVAQTNAQKHQVTEQIEFQQRDLLTGEATQVDLIIANLPYVPTAKLKTLGVYDREPRIALDGGSDGLHVIKEVILTAPQHLLPGGAIFLELDEDCGPAALQLAKDLCPNKSITLSRDLSGFDRYLSLYC